MTIQELRQSVGIEIKKRRISLGLSQEQLSENAGVHPTYIGHIERGAKLPSLKTYLSICKALKVAPGKLLPN